MTKISDLSLMDRLERDIEKLLASNKQLKAENQKLKAENQKLTATGAEWKTKAAELNQQADQLLLRKSVTEVSGGVKAAKLRINRLLKEVDRCIALMNK